MPSDPSDDAPPVDTGPTLEDGGAPTTEDGDVRPEGADGGPATSRAPGSDCDCDAECAGTATHPGLCVQGVCMTRATGACAAAGSAAECPAGSRCWGLDGIDGGICWPDCASHTCAGTCDSDGSCVADASSTCDASCSAICSTAGGCPPNSSLTADGMRCACDEGFMVDADGTGCVAEAPPCTPDSCPAGTVCGAAGTCVSDIGTAPSGTPPTDCRVGSRGVPDWRCTEDCARLIVFDPRRALGYWDYPLNGETEANQYRSFVRRDVMMLVRYATAMVECQATGWAGNGGDLGLGDMSEADGAIPGASIGRPGHPAGTHVNGHDMDIAYYQVGTADNRLRSVCPHVVGGADQHRCVGEPNLLDPWRTALFLGHLHASPNLRIIGVDGFVGPIVDSAMSQLCAGGWLSGNVCTRHRVTWESTNMGRGWFNHHHHHLHVSVSAGTARLSARTAGPDVDDVLHDGCGGGLHTHPYDDLDDVHPLARFVTTPRERWLPRMLDKR